MIIDQFFHWMASAPLDRRCRATAALARSFLVSDLEDRERGALEATLTVLLDDPEPEIRRAMAEILAFSEHAPRHLILALAGDQPDIAEIVLTQSPLILEAELVDFVAEGCEAVQVAVATRTWLSPAITAAIAEVGERSACVSLARNPTASIPLFSQHRLVERFGDDGALREAMLARAHLPIEVRQALLGALSKSLADLAIARNWMTEARVMVATADAVDKTTVLLAAAAGSEDLATLVEHLRATGKLTTTLLLRAATLGDIRFLKEAMALLSGLPRARVEALMIDGREASLKALYLKAGLPPRAFPAFAAAIEVQRELSGEMGLRSRSAGGEYRFANRVVERVLTRRSENDLGAMDDLVVLLRRFATDAARDAARSYVTRVTATMPLALPAPDPVPVEAIRAA